MTMAQRIEVEFSDYEQRIHERLDRAWRMMGGPGSPSSFGTRYLEPPVDVYHTTSEVVVFVEMAGIANREIQLEVEGRMLVIRGNRKALPGPANREYSQIEISEGAFQRAINLPAPVNPQDAKVTYVDGILKIVLPKAASSGGIQLRIVCN
jgi:HSP20 family protein